MAISDLIEQIAAAWPAYHQKERVDSRDPVYAMITVQFPEALQPNVAAFNSIGIEGSTGQGNITAAPWIGLFDWRLTTSATKESSVNLRSESILNCFLEEAPTGATREQLGC
jgi:MrcB-like, N-terminal domain